MPADMDCTWPEACRTLAVALPSTKRAVSSAAASRAGSSGPTTRTVTVSLTLLSSSSATRMMMPCCSISAAKAGSDGASSGSSSHLALTGTSERPRASSTTAFAATRALSAASGASSSPGRGQIRSIFALRCARTPCSCPTARSRQRTQASRSGCCSPCASTRPPSARAAWSSGSSPSATPRMASAAAMRCFGPPRMKIFTGALLDAPASSSTTWRWPWKCTTFRPLWRWFETSSSQRVALLSLWRVLPSGPTTILSADSGTSTDHGGSCAAMCAMPVGRDLNRLIRSSRDLSQGA
mmetsp:Transcript_110779/g.357555  ORF Transcript_110779/g.357555 Transcript_110779/m.357555 type:complete len:296 (+) Transcript_110779:486-1373(+)